MAAEPQQRGAVGAQEGEEALAVDGSAVDEQRGVIRRDPDPAPVEVGPGADALERVHVVGDGAEWTSVSCPLGDHARPGDEGIDNVPSLPRPTLHHAQPASVTGWQRGSP